MTNQMTQDQLAEVQALFPNHAVVQPSDIPYPVALVGPLTFRWERGEWACGVDGTISADGFESAEEALENFRAQFSQFVTDLHAIEQLIASA